MRFCNRKSQCSHTVVSFPQCISPIQSPDAISQSHCRITTLLHCHFIAYRLSFTDAISRLPVHRPINPRIQRFILISHRSFIASHRYCITLLPHRNRIHRKHISQSHIPQAYIAITYIASIYRNPLSHRIITII